jgi:hypothetical protein
MSDELSDLERRLAAWRPAASGNLSRERMLFEAGRASAAPATSGRAPWALAACLALACAGLGAGWAAERGGRLQAENLVVGLTPRDAPTAIEPAPSIPPRPTEIRPPDPSSYLALTQRPEAVLTGTAVPEAGEVPNGTDTPDAGSLRVRGWGRALTL